MKLFRHSIRVNTTSPTSTTHEGTLFAACPITNLIAINTSPPPPTPMTSGTPALSHPGDYHIIPISRIHNFQLLSLPPHSASSSPTEQTPSFANAYPSIYPLDIRALKNREAAAVSKLHEREQRRGKGVSKEAQDLFDAFSRTMPARWDGTSIVVADTVIISKPYHIDNCRSLSPDNGGVSPALTRVRKVVSGIINHLFFLSLVKLIFGYFFPPLAGNGTQEDRTPQRQCRNCQLQPFLFPSSSQ